jgi:hypothetical protein
MADAGAPCTGARDDVFLFAAQVSGVDAAPGDRLRWDFGDGTTLDGPELPRSGEQATVSTRHQFTTAGTFEVRLRHGDATLATASATVTAAESRADRSQRRLARARAGWTVIAGLIAVGSGMTALYFTDPAWGTPGDYVAALLWGGTVAEGIKFVGALSLRRWTGETSPV